MNKRSKGSEYEEKACAYLSINGVRILKQNFRCRYGEIDIIGCDGDTLVFFEVKTRSNFNYGIPSEAINKIKKNHIKKSVEYYLYIHGLLDRYIRVDAIEIVVCNNQYKLMSGYDKIIFLIKNRIKN